MPGDREKVFYLKLMAGFIQLNRCETTDDLLKNPECFLLLTQIALRARRTNEGININGLEVGQALIGDYKSIGLSSEKVYRTAKKKLENFNLVAFKGTNRGTVATLLNSIVYDINEVSRGEQKGEQGANKGRAKGEQGATDGRTRGEQGATNNNGNKEKNGKKVNNENKEKKEVGLFNTDDLLKIVLPWNSEQFAAAWNGWKTYKKKQHGFSYKSEQTEQAALMDLNTKAGGVEMEAIKIINHTMGNGWKGFVIPKNEQQNGNTNTGGNSGTTSRSTPSNASAKTHFSAFAKGYGNGGPTGN